MWFVGKIFVCNIVHRTIHCKDIIADCQYPIGPPKIGVISHYLMAMRPLKLWAIYFQKYLNAVISIYFQMQMLFSFFKNTFTDISTITHFSNCSKINQAYLILCTLVGQNDRISCEACHQGFKQKSQSLCLITSLSPVTLKS